MKILVKSLPFFFLFLCSCGSNSSSEIPVNQQLKEEIEKIETETKAIDEAKLEIDHKTEELDSILNILGNF